MENYSDYLLALAKKFTKAYTKIEGLRAISIGASISKNQATPYSDIDTIVMWDKMPSMELLDKAFEENKAENRTLLNKSEHGCLELYYINGVECQLAHAETEFYEAVVNELAQKETMDPMCHLIADGFSDMIPLFGEDYIESLKERFAAYPAGLGVKTVEKFLRFGPFDELRYRFRKEDNIIWNKDVTSGLIKRVLCVLLGVNKQYIPGDFRKVTNIVNNFEIKPANLYDRIISILSGNPIDIIEDLFTLISETFDIVEKHLPEFDCSKHKAIFLRPQPAIVKKDL